MFKKLKLWFQSRFGYYIRVNREHSTVVISPRLWASIAADHPTDVQFNVLFSRVASDYGTPLYAMFFNPQWEKHGVTNPNMIMTIPVTHSDSGRVGFQSIQPSIELLLVTYGIDEAETTLSVSKEYINGEPYYLINKP